MLRTLIGSLIAVLGLNGAGASAQPHQEEYAAARREMVDVQLRQRGITDPRVLRAMGTVPREEFIPEVLRNQAYWDRPLPIGLEQTISQPYIVAFMTQVCCPEASDRALEIGTGSGYQAAVLSLLVDTVYTVEILPELTQTATRTLERLGYGNVVTDTRDGYRGWPEHAPFDVILVTAAADHIPRPLLDQLAPGGRLVMPVGESWQQLIVAEKDTAGVLAMRTTFDVLFVPMTGEAERRGAQDRTPAD